MLPVVQTSSTAARRRARLGFKREYEINEVDTMGRGDILLIHSDGLTEHSGQMGRMCRCGSQQKVREVKHLGARQILRRPDVRT
jgi:serine phosphatase RsbU (regulator of sigma subunit)